MISSRKPTSSALSTLSHPPLKFQFHRHYNTFTYCNYVPHMKFENSPVILI